MKGGALTRADLAEAVHQEVGLTRQDCADLVERTLELVADALQRGELVKLSGFGVFEVRDKRARMGRNPRRRARSHRPAAGHHLPRLAGDEG